MVKKGCIAKRILCFFNWEVVLKQGFGTAGQEGKNGRGGGEIGHR